MNHTNFTAQVRAAFLLLFASSSSPLAAESGPSGENRVGVRQGPSCAEPWKTSAREAQYIGIPFKSCRVCLPRMKAYAFTPSQGRGARGAPSTPSAATGGAGPREALRLEGFTIRPRKEAAAPLHTGAAPPTHTHTVPVCPRAPCLGEATARVRPRSTWGLENAEFAGVSAKYFRR